MYQPSNIRHIQQCPECFLGPSNLSSSHSCDLWLENFARQERSVLPRGPLHHHYCSSSDRNSTVQRANLREYLVGLYVVVAISGLSIICAIMRLVALILVVHVAPEDISWNSPVIPFVSVLEVYIALIASSVPAIYPLACRSRFFSCWRSKKSDQQPPTEEAWGSNVDTLTYSSDLAAINDSHSSNDPKWFRLKWDRSKSESTVVPTRMEDIPITDVSQVMKCRPSFAPSIPSLPQVLPRYSESHSGSYTRCQELN